MTVLHGVGGELAPPPLVEPGEIGRWFDGRQPVDAAFAVVRLLTLGLGWYLLMTTVLGTAARLAGSGWMVRAADTVTLPAVRRLLGGAVGASLAAVTFTAIAPGAGATAVADDTPGATAAPPASTGPPPTSGAAGAVPTMSRLPDTPPTSLAPPTDTAPPADSPPPSTSPASPPSTAPPATDRTWAVQAGEHFWSVAERVLSEAWSRPPADREVDPYWRALVDANRTVLRDPGNPDLLFPGQVITIPPPPTLPTPPTPPA